MTRRLRSILAWCACAALAPVAYMHARDFIANPSWDAAVYANAIDHFLRGGTPYVKLGGYFFVYPPVVPLTARLLAWLLTPHVGWILFLAANMIAVAVLPLITARFYLPSLTIGEAYVLLLIAPRFVFEPVFWGGNIAAPCYVAALVAGIPGVKRGKWLWFYLTVILVANIKITFLILLLIPFLAGIRQFKSCVATVIATGGAYLLQRICVPALYRDFQHQIVMQTFAGRDYGINVFGVAANLLKRLHIMGYVIPWITYIVFISSILLVLWSLRRKIDLGDERFLALVLVTVVLANPRIAVYDTLFGVIPAYFLMLCNSRRPLAWILAALSVSGYFIGHGDIGYLFGLTAALITGITGLRSEQKLDSTPAMREAQAAG